MSVTLSQMQSLLASSSQGQTITTGVVVGRIDTIVRRIEGKVDDLPTGLVTALVQPLVAALVTPLASAINARPALSDMDVDRIAEAVCDRIAIRMAQ